MSCEGRKVLVIGGGSGIGLASAKALLGAGASLFLSGRRPDPLRRAADELGQQGKVGWHAGDAVQPSEVERVVDRAVAFLGGLDTLVVSAGVSDVASVQDIRPERFDAVIAGNLNPVYLGAHYAAPHLIASRAGSVIAISSVYGVVGQRERVAYSTAKAGIIGMVRSMALDFAPYNVRVNAISPGVIETELFFATLQRRPIRTRCCGSAGRCIRSAARESPRRWRRSSFSWHPRTAASSPGRTSSSTAA